MTTLLITGAAGGIGFPLVRRAVLRGDTVFAVVRNKHEEMLFEHHSNLHTVQMDVSDTSSVERGFVEVDRLLAGRLLEGVINSAAISSPGAIELTSVTEYAEMLNTNALGSLRILKQAIPRLRGHGGRVVLITSLWGRASGSMLSSYCMSKHAIEALADVARRETEGMNMHVIVVEPGVVRTDMYKLQGKKVRLLIDKMLPTQYKLYGQLYERYLRLVGGTGGEGIPDQGITADECAIDIELALFDPKPQPRYQSGSDAKKICDLVRQLSDLEMDAVMEKRLNSAI